MCREALIVLRSYLEAVVPFQRGIIGSFFASKISLIDGRICVTWLWVDNNELLLHNTL